MDDRTARELVRAFAPKLQNEFYLDPFVPLDIKLRLERLRLREMLDAMRCAGTECLEANCLGMAS